MARYRFPSDRSAFVYGSDLAPILTPPRTALAIYADQALTIPANITDVNGVPIADSTVYTTNGVLDEFYGPDGVTRLWAARPGTSPYPLDAQALSVIASGGGASSSLQATGIAAEALSGHRVVTPKPDGTLDYASNDNIAHVQAPLWVTTGAAAAGAQAIALMLGTIVEPTWAWTPGPVYLGANGVLTQTPPTAPGAVFLASVGTATAATSLYVDRGPSIKIT